MSTAYHTALKSSTRITARPRQRAKLRAGVAFVHDLLRGPLPAEYQACDVLYSDLPWQSGFAEFERRAGVAAARSYGAFLAAVSRILQYDSRPAVLVTGKHALPHLPSPAQVLESTLNGDDCLALFYHSESEIVGRFPTTIDLLHWLAERHQCVGDFCCGYGRAGRIFAEHGKQFVMSDYNAECIGYIAETLVKKRNENDLPAPPDPVSNVRWVPIEKVVANDYNPNSVARNEMRLLYISILHDGYTQPVVTIYDELQDKYVIVDGFHRYLICKTYKDIAARTGGRIPIVVIEKSINDRMASTVRHNRARGKHSVDGMANMVFSMLDNGWEDAAICNELGLEAEELLRLKHITGFSKLFEDVEYRKAWETSRQIQHRHQHERAHGQNA